MKTPKEWNAQSWTERLGNWVYENPWHALIFFGVAVVVTLVGCVLYAKHFLV